MSSPYRPQYGIISVGGTQIGAGLVTSSGVTVEKEVDEYYGVGGSGEPTALVQGNRSYSGKFSKAYIDAAYANIVLGTAEAEVILYPKGTAVGNPKITCSNCVFSGEDFSMNEDAVVAEDLSFVAKSVAFGTA